jgi:hypothetical protein
LNRICRRNSASGWAAHQSGYSCQLGPMIKSNQKSSGEGGDQPQHQAENGIDEEQ